MVDNPLNLSDKDLKMAGVDINTFRLAVGRSSTGDDLGTLNVLEDPLWPERMDAQDKFFGEILQGTDGNIIAKIIGRCRNKRNLSKVNKLDEKIRENSNAIKSGEFVAAAIYSRRNKEK